MWTITCWRVKLPNNVNSDVVCLPQRVLEWKRERVNGGEAATPQEDISFAGGLQRDAQGAAAMQTLFFLLRTVVEEHIQLLVKVRTEYWKSNKGGVSAVINLMCWVAPVSARPQAAFRMEKQPRHLDLTAGVRSRCLGCLISHFLCKRPLRVWVTDRWGAVLLCCTRCGLRMLWLPLTDSWPSPPCFTR